MTTCKRPTCPNKARTRGYCGKHAKFTQLPTPTRQQCLDLCDRLVELGYTDREICTAAGLFRDNIQRLRSGYLSHFRGDTFAKIKNLLDCPPRFVPSIIPTRQVQALLALGITVKQISEESGMGPRIITSITRGEYGRIALSKAQKIDALYASHEGDKKADYVRPQYRNFAPPAAWDDIRDPACEPEGFRKAKSPVRRVGNTELVQGRLQDLARVYGGNSAAEMLRVTPYRFRDVLYGETRTIDLNFSIRILNHWRKLPVEERRAA